MIALATRPGPLFFSAFFPPLSSALLVDGATRRMAFLTLATELEKKVFLGEESEDEDFGIRGWCSSSLGTGRAIAGAMAAATRMNAIKSLN